MSGVRPVHEGWYVAITRTRSENQVWETMKAWDVTARLYQVRRTITQRGALIERLFPAFTGYIFTYADADWYYHIRKIKGVLNFLSLDREGYPTPISPYEISRLDALADKDLVFGTYDPIGRPFKKGDAIRIVSGPFREMTATFVRSIKGTYIVANLDLMGRVIPITLAMHQLERVEQKEDAEPKPRHRRTNRTTIAESTPACV